MPRIWWRPMWPSLFAARSAALKRNVPSGVGPRGIRCGSSQGAQRLRPSVGTGLYPRAPPGAFRNIRGFTPLNPTESTTMATKHGVRLALAATASLAALTGVGTASASADQYSTYGDIAIQQNAPLFRLNPNSLEPGCFRPGHNDFHNGVPIDAHIDVTQRVGNVQISVDRGTNFSIDQVLVPGQRSGYVVYNTFDTGTSNTDADID